MYKGIVLVSSNESSRPIWDRQQPELRHVLQTPSLRGAARHNACRRAPTTCCSRATQHSILLYTVQNIPALPDTITKTWFVLMNGVEWKLFQNPHSK